MKIEIDFREKEDEGLKEDDVLEALGGSFV